ncbi:MAG: anti-sigma factor [Deltaproteobacteria bacterium]|nr:MAG: anti-sigma factor [Deltaproteobacteria bacterium]
MAKTLSINGDLSQSVVMHTSSMEWLPSPSGSVLRKRVHLVGGAEAGQVTSVVRYLENSSFAAHDHPEGEEILVLDGVFSDEHGDWPAGSYLLNPEGFRHAPFSKPGCLIFVKLRQYGGRGRRHVALCTHELPWKSGPHAGIELKLLYSEAGFPDEMRLERWAPGATPGTVSYEGGAEILVLRGRLEDEQGSYDKLSWLRLPAGATHTPVSPNGCELYLKTGAVPSLRSG